MVVPGAWTEAGFCLRDSVACSWKACIQLLLACCAGFDVLFAVLTVYGAHQEDALETQNRQRQVIAEADAVVNSVDMMGSVTAETLFADAAVFAGNDNREQV